MALTRGISDGSSLSGGVGVGVARQGSFGSGNPPAPPPGLPPPRPPGLQRADVPAREALAPRENNGFPSRAVRFDGLPKIRSLSCDDVISRRPIVVDDDAKADTDVEGDVANPFGRIQSHGQGHHILVAVRCRPLHHQETLIGGRGILRVVPINNMVVLEDPQTTAADDYLRLNKSKERRFAFDEVFNEFAGTHQVYEKTTRFLIGGVLQGFNATVFAYGATGAGKTHTMLGNPSEPGIMMLTLLDLFNEVDGQREERLFDVKCSFLEVYNENIRDLLRPDGDYLDIREDPVKGMCVAGISEVGGIESASEIMSLLHQANKHRTTEATGANVTSSRSHAVLQVVVEQRDRTAGIVAQVNLGKLSMIDLAGSERASQTYNKGMRMIEGANINRSLLALGNCITALSSAVAFVPYRDSKMTRLLKDSLGGNCRTVMIANCSPCHLNYEDTHNTLKYANRAKNIKTKAVRNVVRVNRHVSKYTEIIKELRGEIAELKGKLANAPEQTQPGALAPITTDVVTDDDAGDAGDAGDAADGAKWKQELMQNFEERVRIKRRLIDLAHEAQSQMVEKSHAQVGISQWESSQVRGDGGSTGAAGHETETGVDATPRSIKDLQEKLRSIKTEMAHTEETTHGLEEQLMSNQQRAERLQAELPKRVQNKDMRAFLGLMSRIYVMEVENMDLQEMNDVTAPLINQKELEAEALRLQIQMRDRMIAEHDQLLSDEGAALLQKPEGWLEVKAKPTRPVPNPLSYLDEDDDRTVMKRAASLGVYSDQGNDLLALPALSPSPDRHTSPEPPPLPAGRKVPPANSPPPGAQLGIPGNAIVVEGNAAPCGRRSRPSSASAGPRGQAAMQPTGLGSMSNLTTDNELPPLDVAGRGLGRPPRLSSDASDADGTTRRPSHGLNGGTSPAGPLGGFVGGGGPSPQGGISLAYGGPYAAAAGPESRGRNASAPSGKRRSRKNRRGGDGAARAALRDRERERQMAHHLHIEASGLQRDRDDSQDAGSDSERDAVPKDAPTAREVAADHRKGIIDKLNKRMKPASVGGPKHLS